MKPILTIAIPTVEGREAKFDRLVSELQRQIAEDSLQGLINIIYAKDNKEISIGQKRDGLYKQSNGIYTVQLDDDDGVHQQYCTLTIQSCMHNTDCIGYFERCNINGQISKSVFSRSYPDWIENLPLTDKFRKNHGAVRVRTPFFKCPIKTDLCQQVGVKDMRFGEDHDFSRRILPLLKTETFIYEEMYHYNYEKEGTHNERYGIR